MDVTDDQDPRSGREPIHANIWRTAKLLRGEDRMAKLYDPSQPLISVHVPKCAGTSFYDVLRNWFKSGFLRHYPNERTGAEPTRHSLAWRKLLRIPVCIHGHFNFQRGSGFDAYYPGSTQIITIVRDPWELNISNYFYGKRRLHQGKLYRSGRNIAEEYPETLREYLCKQNKSFIPSFFPKEMNLGNFRDILEERYLFVGTSEDLSGSVQQLADLLGYKPPIVKHLNPSQWDEASALEDLGSLKSRFHDNNELAYAIYNYARNKNRQPGVMAEAN